MPDRSNGNSLDTESSPQATAAPAGQPWPVGRLGLGGPRSPEEIADRAEQIAAALAVGMARVYDLRFIPEGEDGPCSWPAVEWGLHIRLLKSHIVPRPGAIRPVLIHLGGNNMGEVCRELRTGARLLGREANELEVAEGPAARANTAICLECTLSEFIAALRQAANLIRGKVAGQAHGAKVAAGVGDAALGIAANKEKPDLSKEALVIATLQDHPDWTDTRIAKEAGCNPKSVYRMKSFVRAKELLKRGRLLSIPRGSKSKDGAMEAWDDPRPDDLGEPSEP